MSEMIEENPDSSWPRLAENSRRRVIDELVNGQELATKLQILLQSPSTGDEDRRLLVAKVLSSFNEALSAIESSGNELPQDSLCSDLDSGDSRTVVLKDRKPASNKRRRKVSAMKIVVSPTIEDGQGWRKYGQKAILNAKNPRSYYRCTHKQDQNCMATKQVQKIDGDSENYKITYIGHHICSLSPPILTSFDSATDDNSYDISFSESNRNRQWPASATKEENWVPKEETTSGLTDNLSSFDETGIWTDLEDFGWEDFEEFGRKR